MKFFTSFKCNRLSAKVPSCPEVFIFVTTHTGSVSVVSNVPLWSLSICHCQRCQGSGNHGDRVSPELLEVLEPPGHHRSNYKNLSGSIHLLCQVGYSPLTKSQRNVSRAVNLTSAQQRKSCDMISICRAHMETFLLSVLSHLCS